MELLLPFLNGVRHQLQVIDVIAAPTVYLFAPLEDVAGNLSGVRHSVHLMPVASAALTDSGCVVHLRARMPSLCVSVVNVAVHTFSVLTRYVGEIDVACAAGN